MTAGIHSVMDADSPGSRSVFYDEGDTVVVTINSYSPDGTMATDDDHFTNGDRSTQCQLYQNGQSTIYMIHVYLSTL